MRTNSSRCAADFFLSLYEELHVHRQPAHLRDAGFDCFVHEDLALVVGCAARVSSPSRTVASNGGVVQRSTGPPAARRNARRKGSSAAGRTEPLAIHNRIPWRFNQPHVLHPRAFNGIGRPFAGSRTSPACWGSALMLGIARHCELVYIPIAVDVDEINDVVHGSTICHTSSRHAALPSRSSSQMRGNCFSRAPAARP